jgi:hypothetical protein
MDEGWRAASGSPAQKRHKRSKQKNSNKKKRTQNSGHHNLGALMGGQRGAAFGDPPHFASTGSPGPNKKKRNRNNNKKSPGSFDPYNPSGTFQYKQSQGGRGARGGRQGNVDRAAQLAERTRELESTTVLQCLFYHIPHCTKMFKMGHGLNFNFLFFVALSKKMRAIHDSTFASS